MKKRNTGIKAQLLLGLLCILVMVIATILKINRYISSDIYDGVYIVVLLAWLIGVIFFIVMGVIAYVRIGMKNMTSCGIPIYDKLDWYREHWGETKEYYEKMINVIRFFYKKGGKVDEEVGNNLMQLYCRLDYLNELLKAKDYLINCFMSIGISFTTSCIMSSFSDSEKSDIFQIIVLIISLVGIVCVMLFPYSEMMKVGSKRIFEYEKKLLLQKIEKVEEAVVIPDIDEESLMRRQNILMSLIKQTKKSHGKRKEELIQAIREVEQLDLYKRSK